MSNRKCFKCGAPVTTGIRFDVVAHADSHLPFTRTTRSDCCCSCAVDVLRQISMDAMAFATDIAIALSQPKGDDS